MVSHSVNISPFLRRPAQARPCQLPLAASALKTLLQHAILLLGGRMFGFRPRISRFAVAGKPGKCLVDGDDMVAGIGYHHRFAAVLIDHRRKPDLILVLAARGKNRAPTPGSPLRRRIDIAVSSTLLRNGSPLAPVHPFEEIRAFVQRLPITSADFSAEERPSG